MSLNDDWEAFSPNKQEREGLALVPTETKEEVVTDTLRPLEGQQGHLGTGSAKGVSLSNVLDEVAAFNRRFIYHKDDAAHDVIALWTVHTFAMDRWSITPRLYINAPQAGVGKSKQGKIVQYLGNNGIKSGSATPAYIFGKVAEHEGAVTILLDEADNIWSKGKDTSDLQALINEGYEYGATVGRGNSTDAGIVGMTYEAYCPVVIIGIKNSRIPATTLSRCINIKMHLPTANVSLERFIARKHEAACNDLRERIQEAASSLPDYEEMDAPEGLSLRGWDIWEPLFIIAKEAGGDWPERVLKASHVLNGSEPTLSPAQKVLMLTFECLKEQQRATPKTIADYINAQDDLFELDGQRVSYYLGTYDIESKKSNGQRVFALDDVRPVAEQWTPEGYTHPQNPSLADPAVPDTDVHPSQKPTLGVPAVPEPVETDNPLKGSSWEGVLSYGTDDVQAPQKPSLSVPAVPAATGWEDEKW